MFASDPLRHISLVALLCLAACDEQKPEENTKPPRSKTAYNFDEVISFGERGTAARYIRGGWGAAEKDRTWTNAASASLRITPPDTDQPLLLRMKLAGFTNAPSLPYQPVQVYVNNERVADWQVVSEPADFIAIIPQPLAARERLIIELRMPLANSPKVLGIGEDVRMLGVSCFEAVITRTTEDVAHQAAEERGRDPLTGIDNAYALGTVVYLGAGGGGQRYKTSGWHTAEKNHAWTGSDAGVLELVVRPTEQPLKVRMRLAGMTKPPDLVTQPTQVFANGEKIADWEVGEPGEFTAVIPPELIQEKGALKIELRARAPASPNELELGDDIRRLGVRCETLVIEEAPGETNRNVRRSAKAAPSPRESR